MTTGQSPDVLREQWLDWAVQTGRIVAASRPAWVERWDRDPEVCRSWLSLAAPVEYVAAANAASPTAARPSSYTGGPSQTASGLDVSRLPRRLQAAAAREADRGKVYGWIERYAGMSDAEVDPLTLGIDGESDLATQVQQDEAAAWAAAKQAENKAIEIANEAHQRQLMAEADRRREEAMARYREPSE